MHSSNTDKETMKIMIIIKKSKKKKTTSLMSSNAKIVNSQTSTKTKFNLKLWRTITKSTLTPQTHCTKEVQEIVGNNNHQRNKGKTLYKRQMNSLKCDLKLIK